MVAEVLRGVAQVDFMPSVVCGALFVAALFAAGPAYGLYGLLGSAVSTAVAYGLGLDRRAVGIGLHGYNGCLVALGCAVLLGGGRPATVAVAVLGSAVVVVVTAGLGTVLSTWRLPALTAPFCLVSTALAAAAPGLRRLWRGAAEPAALPVAAVGETGLGWDRLWRGFFANIGQVFLLPQWYVGLLFLAGLFAASRLAGVMACAGSATALLTAWAFGAPAEAVGQGLLGYSGVLVALALCGVFVAPSAWSAGYALLGAATATVLTPALDAICAPFGGHAFTWPFVLTAMLFLAAVPAVPRLRRV
ncbi:urea transporter [Kitasatospora xanthocidica]|uniref:urea transporter n=1 Tax=Kitasatospora xanthocidica TaxID=83382 RepID=UPI0019C5CF0F|nr:urea transporter [Kitasatospora xanthocidica]GHF35144.1 urea transporter [Kitasatospora xanthocidica]